MPNTDSEDTKCLEATDGNISILGFEPQCVSHGNENLGVENEDGVTANQEKYGANLVDEGKADILKEIKKAWEMGKILGVLC